MFTSGALWNGIRRQSGNPRCGRPSPGQNRNFPGFYTLPGNMPRLFATPAKSFVRAPGSQMANISTYIATDGFPLYQNRQGKPRMVSWEGISLYITILTIREPVSTFGYPGKDWYRNLLIWPNNVPLSALKTGRGLISAYLSDRPGPRMECNARRSTDTR